MRPAAASAVGYAVQAGPLQLIGHREIFQVLDGSTGLNVCPAALHSCLVSIPSFSSVSLLEGQYEPCMLAAFTFGFHFYS